ncbi:MAG: SURF1 family protein [Cellvibrionaceae bacterium]
MKLALSLNRRVTALAVLLLPILLSLGVWQLQRAEEKRAIETRYMARQQLSPLTLGELDNVSDQAFLPIRLAGRFDNRHSFLLDNRTREGRPGYEVLTPLLTGDGRWVLVNRGWIKASPIRQDLPVIPPIEARVEISGTVYIPPDEPFLLAEQTFQTVEWPLVVQAVEIDKFAALLDRALFPQVIRLRQGSAGALQVGWQPVNTQPQKHVAYAVQWFALALGLALWFVFANTNLWQWLNAVRRGHGGN